MKRGYLRLTCVAVIAVSLTGCSVMWSGNIYRIGPRSSGDARWFHTRKDCEAWVAEQKKNGNASSGSCDFMVYGLFEELPDKPLYH
jgi:hypothetical protein